MCAEKNNFAKLVNELSSPTAATAERAADTLNSIIYPNWSSGPGPHVITWSDENTRQTHFPALQRPEIIDPLIAALRLGSEFAREYAATVFGMICDEHALAPLIDALQDRCASVRSAAARSLGWFQSSAPVPGLIRALGDASPQVREAAISALGYIRSSEAVPALTELFHNGNLKCQSHALYALGMIGDAESLPLARVSLSHKLREVRKAAKAVLGMYDLKRRAAK
ncbi:MAG TPA: HEAT repeat domain-containing protein [Verrucomicrobiae bacterium]